MRRSDHEIDLYPGFRGLAELRDYRFVRQVVHLEEDVSGFAFLFLSCNQSSETVSKVYGRYEKMFELRRTEQPHPRGPFQEVEHVNDLLRDLRIGREKDAVDIGSSRDFIEVSRREPREELLFFASDTPIRGHFNVTAFNDEWKLVQEIDQGLLAADVTTHLFKIEEDPNEHHNLAASHPEVVEELGEAIYAWRNLYPVSGTRHELVPPPGWRAPKDWVTYPQPIDELQSEPAPGMPPPDALRALDWLHGEVGRLIYDCEPYPWVGGGLCR